MTRLHPKVPEYYSKEIVNSQINGSSLEVFPVQDNVLTLAAWYSLAAGPCGDADVFHEERMGTEACSSQI